MGKISIGLRGWRFEESDVFDENDEFLPLAEMDPDVRSRITRLTALVGSPCDACWLIHGDENLPECNVSEVVYGEPLNEVSVCAEHERDFRYWYAEEGGERFRGQADLADEFHEWFLDGGRAPDGYEGFEHVDTDPENVPRPPEPSPEDFAVEQNEEKRIDLRDVDLSKDYPS